MRAIVVAIAVLALFACTSVAQETAVEAPRFMEAEHEDAATLAEQQADFEALMEGEEESDEVEAEEEGEEEADNEIEADEESEEEAEEADESEEETEEADESEGEEEADEESEEEADQQNEEESEEEADEESEDHSEYVLAELKDNAVMTGFMEMIASFIPTAAKPAEHMVHSLSSHQTAAAEQQYAVGYAHGHADAHADAQRTTDSDDVEEGEGEEESDEASFVEGSAKADSEHHPVYTAQYYAGYPNVAGVYYQPHYGTPMPPQLPTWLPPPPYISPVPEKSADE